VATLTLKALEDARALYDATVEELHLRFKNDITYHETRPDDSMRRPLFVVKNQADLDHIKSVINILMKIKSDIDQMSGKKSVIPLPALEEHVLLYRIWENIDRSSTAALCSRHEIINRLKRRIATIERYNDETSNLFCNQLKKELDFFENDTEEVYRARSKGRLTSVVGLTCNNSIDKRLRINEAGLFIVGPMFEEPKGAFPSKEKTRKERTSIYSGIDPVPYCGAMNTELYRESEIEARKQAIGWDDNKQDAVKEKRRNKSTRRIKTAS
jgi:hypothetical protein